MYQFKDSGRDAPDWETITKVEIVGGDAVDGLAATLGSLTDAEYRRWVQYLGGDADVDTTKIVTVMGAAFIGIAFLFVVISPAFPNVIVPQGTVEAVFGFFGAAFGAGASLFSHKQGSDQTMQAMGK